MARNGSGTYALASGNPVVTGTTISSTTHNNTMTDLASEMTNSLAKDGQTVITGALDYNGNELILDTDGDTSITADTDDQIDFKVAGADDFQITANTFTALSGSSIATNTIVETTAASGVTIDSVLLKDNTALVGTLLLGAGSVTDSSGAITFGNENLSTTGTLASGALTVTGDVTLSAGDINVTSATATTGQNGFIDLDRSTTSGDFFPATFSWSDGEGYNFLVSDSGTPYFGVEYHTTGGTRTGLMLLYQSGNVEFPSGDATFAGHITQTSGAPTYIKQSADTGHLIVMGSDSTTNGAWMQLSGNSDSGNPGDYLVGSGASTVQFYDDSTSTHYFYTGGTAFLTANSSQDATFAGDVFVTNATGVAKAVVTSSTGTNEAFYQATNTGGSYYFGADNSAGSWFGSAAYAAVLYAPAGKEIHLSQGGTSRLTIDGSGDATFAGDVTLSAGDLAVSAGQLNLTRGTTDAAFFDFIATADGDSTSAISTLTTSGATTHHIQVDINGTKAWIAVSTNAPS